ncbi:hypothetical protein ACTMTI_23585 [Nonomuraea sp. H19]|uniref:hypothetical protein n=1 Tax=Nonomuraea sp. H19 TaxID=3452206 RepID=UPI003F88E68D
MPGSPIASAPSTVGAWTRRLHAILTTALVLGVLAFLARLVAGVILAVPTGKADYGFTGLWPSRAGVSLDGALAPGVRALDVMVEATLHDPARAPLLAVLMGVGAFVVAEVIGRGLAMLDEFEGTI